MQEVHQISETLVKIRAGRFDTIVGETPYGANDNDDDNLGSIVSVTVNDAGAFNLDDFAGEGGLDNVKVTKSKKPKRKWKKI